ncbi:SH3 domain-containing protein [Clostridium baratii]|uniref:SH3 domain-containing protein n=1 Tax=Clostridium baratii TaxID=1561 RepID=UPI001C02D5E0|nr:SH3 domain-containing protein [Clostridium baratii]MBT9830304.1 SH3 domain-containing protein [Clostridium baratii]
MNFKASIRKKLTAMTILMVFVINICSVNVVEASTLFKNKVKLETRKLKSNNEANILHYDTKDDKETDKKTQTSDNTTGDISENKDTSKKENISKDDNLEDKLKKEQSISDYNKIDIALSGILQEKNNVEINTDDINKIKDIVPKENGIYILAKDREVINNIINKTLGKKYYIDEEGFIKKSSNKSNNLKETEKSKEYSKIINNILSENKKVIIAKSEKWAEFNDKEQKIEIKNFNSNKKSVKFNDKVGRDLLILNGENELDLEEILFKELKNISTLKDDSDDSSNEEVKEDSKNNNDIKINDETKKESDKKENSKENSNEKSNEEKNIDNKNDKKIDEDIKEKEETSSVEDEDKHITKNLDIFDVAIVGLLGNEKTEVNEENINKFKNEIPKGNGVWILEKDRKGIINIINNVASKKYYIDNNGFLRCTGNNNKNTKNSKICSGILDKLINSDKVTIIGRDNGWKEYSINEEKVINKKFTDDNAGVTIGGKGTNQLIILSEKAKDDENMAFVLFHELIHGLRGQEGKKDRLEEELFAGTIENYIRKELGYSLRDLSNLEKAYKDYSSIYRDDWNRIAFEYSQAFFGTVKLKDPTSSLNIRSTPSTSANIIGSLAHGTSVSILDKSGDWYKISYNGKIGYIKGEFLNLGSAEGATTGTIRLQDSSSSLNMRSGPSTNSNVVGSLAHGTVVNILGTSGQWYKISYNGKVGYVRGDYLTLGGASAGSGSGTGTIKLNDPSSSLNVRSGPSTNTSVVGSLAHGTVVQITGKSGDWYKINFNGTTGYVKGDFVTLGGSISSGNGIVTLKDPSSALNVRSSASITSNVVGSLAHGTVVKIIGTEGQWYKIEFNGGIGYVKNEFITKGGTIGSGNGTIVLQDPSSSLNVRNGASLSSGVIGSLSHGSVVEIIGTEGQWYKIKFNGGTGYVKNDFVTLGGSMGSSKGTGTIQLQDPSSSLNVRSGASITSGVIGSLQHGSIIQIIGTEGEWYKISFNGKVGYVRGDYVRLGAASGGAGNTGTIKLQDPSSSLNVRSSASINSSVIGSLPYGSVVEIIGTEGQWYKIKFNGKVGYVRSDYVVRGGSLSIGSDKYESSFKDGYIRYYAQDDPRYGNIMYSNHGDRGQTIANSACGPSAFSIVVSTLNNIDVPPTEICRYALSHGYRTYNEGTSRYLFSGISNDSANPRYNLNYQSVGSISGVKSILSDNKHLVIVSMRPGHVTQQGHYIVLAGYTTINGKVYFKVYDPHRWNEFYIYDGEIIDTVKDDGFILLSQNVIMNESQGYFAFSSKNGSALKPGSGSSSSTNSSHSSSGSSSSNNSSSKKPSGKVEKKEEFDPSKMFETIKLNINNYEIDYRWEYFNGAYRLMPIFDVKNLEKLHHAYAPQVTPSEFVSMIISFTPLDAAKDFIDFIYGKDIVTNDKINRGVLFACIFLPDVADELIKKGVKNSDELVKVFKGVEKKFTINNAKQVNTKNPLSNIKYTEKVKKQATQADYHGFPESVDGFGACGKITNITGGDGIVRKQIEIPGSYMGKEGVFQYIIEADGVSCNHRLFVPNK